MAIDQNRCSYTSVSAGVRAPPQNSSPDQADTQVLRCSQSIENFSRLATRTSFSPITPPKRVSSRYVLKASSAPHERVAAVVDISTSSKRPRRKSSRRSTIPLPLAVEVNQEKSANSTVVGHAITTTDDSARHLKCSPLPRIPSDLEDVLEESETDIHFTRGEHSTHRHNKSLPLRHVQSLPTTRLAPALGHLANKRHTSPGLWIHQDRVLANSILTWCPPRRRHSQMKEHRISIGLGPINVDDWEDVVDYCYEQHAEADSDFDWNHIMANTTATIESSRRQSDAASSLPELESSATSSFESTDWEGTMNSHNPAMPLSSPPKNARPRMSPRISYSLFPSAPTSPSPTT